MNICFKSSAIAFALMGIAACSPPAAYETLPKQLATAEAPLFEFSHDHLSEVKFEGITGDDLRFYSVITPGRGVIAAAEDTYMERILFLMTEAGKRNYNTIFLLARDNELRLRVFEYRLPMPNGEVATPQPGIGDSRLIVQTTPAIPGEKKPGEIMVKAGKIYLDGKDVSLSVLSRAEYALPSVVPIICGKDAAWRDIVDVLNVILQRGVAYSFLRDDR